MPYFNLLLHSLVSNDGGGKNIGPSQNFFVVVV